MRPRRKRPEAVGSRSAGGDHSDPSRSRSGGTTTTHITPIPVKLGTAFWTDKRDREEIPRIIHDRNWPRQARRHVQPAGQYKAGLGTCLGATYELGQTRLGRMTDAMSDICIRLNSMMNKYVSNFTWTSIQININTVSQRHCDANNVGPSAIFIFGDHAGGNFETSTGMRVGTGAGALFDGRKDHWSTLYEGKLRVSIVFFTHSQQNNSKLPRRTSS